MKKLTGMLGLILPLVLASPSYAVTTFFGVDYNLTGAYTSADKTTAHFVLDISKINGPADVADEGGGRYGVESYAFLKPDGLVSGSSPGFTFQFGGINAAGCNTTGNFFCFKDILPNPSTVLPANSTLQFTFDLVLAAGFNLDDYNDSFKINWIGDKNNYDLISQHLGVTGGITPFVVAETPIPGAVWLFGSGIVGIAALSRRRKNKKLELAVA